MLVNFFWLLCLQRGAAFGSPAAPIGARMRLEDVTLTRELTRRFGPLSRSNGKRGVRREKNGEDKTGIKVEDSRLSEKTFHNSCAKNCRRPRGCGDRTCGAFGRRGSRARTAGRGEVAARAPAARSLLVCDPHGARATALARAAPLLRAHVPRRAYARVPHVHTIKKKKTEKNEGKKHRLKSAVFLRGWLCAIWRRGTWRVCCRRSSGTRPAILCRASRWTRSSARSCGSRARTPCARLALPAPILLRFRLEREREFCPSGGGREESRTYFRSFELKRTRARIVWLFPEHDPQSKS